MLMKALASRETAGAYLPCVLSGLLLGLSYPSYPYVRLEVLAWVWMAPLLLSLKEVRSLPRFLGRVYLAAFVVCAVGMSWLLTATALGTLLLFFVGALVFTVPFVGFYVVRRAFGWRAALWSAPILWTAWDWLYHRSEGSFGWLSMGVTQSNLYWLVQYVDVTGVWGVTFWLVLFNVLVVASAEDWLAARGGPAGGRAAAKFLARRLAAACVLMLGLPLAYTAYVFTRPEAGTGPGLGGLSVLLMQPNVNPWEKLSEGPRHAVLRKTLGLTNKALAGSAETPDLIVWPETAVPYLLSDSKEAREAVYRAVTRWETPLLTGLFDRGAGEGRHEIFNAAALLSPGPAVPGRRFNVEVSPAYHKRVLMPFVERVPFVERFPALQRLAVDIGAGDRVSRGREARVFTLRTRRGEEATVAAAICYEYLYPAEVADLVRGGAQVLAFVTNEGWFSRTHGEYQMAAFSRLRAVETRRAVARAANTGMTELIDRYGRVQAQVPWWSEQSLAGRVALSDELSLYVRYTDYFPAACAWAALAILLPASLFGARAALRSFKAAAASSAEVRLEGALP
jgi:apolipoprotein N-acyltransferase